MSTASAAATEELVSRLRAGDTRALARGISLVENNAPQASALLSACFAHTGHALRIGVTGSPGAGKSTLVDQLARAYRAAGKTVGVIAVDPSSPFTGGALLGDRIRMQERMGDAGLYVRSMATRGWLGGLAQATADIATVIEASGKQIVLVETVGVGQDEIEVARLADITLVVLVPGMGDDVQSIKAGIMEIADIFVVNKSDREGADRVEKEIRAMQSLAGSHGSWIPPVIRTVATTGEGIGDLAAAIARMEQWFAGEDRLVQRRKAYWKERIVAMLRQELLRGALQHGLTPAELDRCAEQIALHRDDPYRMIPRLVEEIFERSHNRS